MATTSPSSKSLPRILCLHGGGSSAAIFHAQSRNLRSLLSSHFTFTFIDAPLPSPAGPGVLPLYKDMGPFYRWEWPRGSEEYGDIGEEQRTAEGRVVVRRLDAEMKKAREGEDGEENANRGFVGVMGFSQGARAAAGLLMREQRKKEKVSAARDDNGEGCLTFGVMVAGVAPPIGGPGPRREMIQATDGNRDADGDEERIRMPTVHVYGLTDPILKNMPTLLDQCCERRTAKLLEFDGEHHLPRLAEDTEKFAALVMEAWKLGCLPDTS
ncbi:hypothetical protein MMC19_000657 [Ptychographa xylographoides]|nr:hypothetical protein [Ptychographa xylographoides]